MPAVIVDSTQQPALVLKYAELKVVTLPTRKQRDKSVTTRPTTELVCSAAALLSPLFAPTANRADFRWQPVALEFVPEARLNRMVVSLEHVPVPHRALAMRYVQVVDAFLASNYDFVALPRRR